MNTSLGQYTAILSSCDSESRPGVLTAAKGSRPTNSMLPKAFVGCGKRQGQDDALSATLTLHLVLRLQSGMQMFIKSTGLSKVEPSDSIKNVKAKIQVHINIQQTEWRIHKYHRHTHGQTHTHTE